MIEISVIVPVYRSQATLQSCVHSIQQQTCRSFEILLIDDGSPDECPALCDEYAAQDSRIRVIHQKNGGLSAARNTGIEAAQGRWLAFVDSDDRIEPAMLQKLLEAAEETGADMAVCGLVEEDEEHTVLCRRLLPPGVCTPAEALRLMLVSGGGEYACNKLFRAELFRSIRFPVGRRYEDIAVCYKLVYASARIVFIDFYGYYYLRHEGSITFSQEVDVQADHLRGRLEKWAFIQKYFPALDPLMRHEVLQSCAYLYEKIYRAGIRQYRSEAKELRKVVRSARRGAHCPHFSNRLTVLLLSLSPRLYTIMASFLKRL